MFSDCVNYVKTIIHINYDPSFVKVVIRRNSWFLLNGLKQIHGIYSFFKKDKT